MAEIEAQEASTDNLIDSKYWELNSREMNLKEADLDFRKEVWADIKSFGFNLLAELVKMQNKA